MLGRIEVLPSAKLTCHLCNTKYTRQNLHQNHFDLNKNKHCDGVNLALIDPQILVDKDKLKEWKLKMVVATRQHSAEIKENKTEEPYSEDLSPEDKFNAETLTNAVRAWNISASGRNSLDLEVREHLEKFGVKGLCDEEKKKLVYSGNMQKHQKRVLRYFFGDGTFRIKDLSRLKSFLGTTQCEAAFCSAHPRKCKTKYISYGYRANIINSLKHLISFLQAKTSDPLVEKMADKLYLVFSRLHNGAMDKVRYETRLRNALSPEADKLIDFDLLSQKFLNGEKHLKVWQTVRDWMETGEKLTSDQIYSILADTCLGLALETVKRPGVFEGLTIGDIRNPVKDETADGTFFNITVKPKASFTGFKSVIQPCMRIPESLYNFIKVVADIRATEIGKETNVEDVKLFRSKTGCLPHVNKLFKDALQGCGVQHFTPTTIRRTIVTLGFQSKITSPECMTALGKSLDHSPATAFRVYCNKAKLNQTTEAERRNTIGRILSETKWQYEFDKICKISDDD